MSDEVEPSLGAPARLSLADEVEGAARRSSASQWRVARVFGVRTRPFTDDDRLLSGEAALSAVTLKRRISAMRTGDPGSAGESGGAGGGRGEGGRTSSSAVVSSSRRCALTRACAAGDMVNAKGVVGVLCTEGSSSGTVGELGAALLLANDTALHSSAWLVGRISFRLVICICITRSSSSSESDAADDAEESERNEARRFRIGVWTSPCRDAVSTAPSGCQPSPTCLRCGVAQRDVQPDVGAEPTSEDESERSVAVLLIGVGSHGSLAVTLPADFPSTGVKWSP